MAEIKLPICVMGEWIGKQSTLKICKGLKLEDFEKLAQCYKGQCQEAARWADWNGQCGLCGVRYSNCFPNFEEWLCSLVKEHKAMLKAGLEDSCWPLQ